MLREWLDDKAVHHWEKSSLVTQADQEAGRMFDAYRCTECSATGKRIGLNDFVTLDKEYQGQEFEKCPQVLKGEVPMVKKAKAQPNLPGVEDPPEVAEVKEAIELLDEAIDARVAASNKETEANKAACAVMKKHKLTVYPFNGHRFLREAKDPTEKVKRLNAKKDGKKGDES